jgi:protoporphyrinogen oxidase
VKIAIVGGGLMGVSLGYHLAQEGVQVHLYEASAELGGLAGAVTLEDGTAVDRFYHTILSSDVHLRELCTALGLADQLRFRETRMGFYHREQLYSMNNIIEFLRFPPLGWIDRFRLGLTVLYAQLVHDWRRLERINVEEWLLRWSGQRTFENIWRPMLKAKFDGSFENTPATYIWSRLVRVKSTRSGASQKEEAGHLIGGFMTLIRAMAESIVATGGKVHLNSPVQEIVVEDGRARGLRVDGQVQRFHAIVATVQLPLFRQLIPGADARYRGLLSRTEYLGVICPLLVLDRPLSGYWTLNITDDSIPFTGVIETTTYIDPQYVGGHHFVYLPKYTAPGSSWQDASDDEIQRVWLYHLGRIFPDLDQGRIRRFLVHRARYVEPLHGLDATHLIPKVGTPLRGLYLATTAQIYPALTNSESVTRHARQCARQVLQESTAGIPGLEGAFGQVATAEIAC